ncbi:MAG: MerR family transcriptional regulator [Kiritimatiellia bacterium]
MMPIVPLYPMKKYRISQLAQESGLSRSTLLYYDRIRLLPSSGRTASGYRFYTDKDLARLKQVCHFRQAGLDLSAIKTLLAGKGKPHAKVLEKRLLETSRQIVSLRNQQRLLAGMLKNISAGVIPPPTADKTLWVAMMRSAGMSDESMKRWHLEFERRAPQAHHEFLASLGLNDPEIRRIRAWSDQV